MELQDETLEVVNVSVDASAVWGGGDALLERLASELPEAAGPRLIFLPPLLANLIACDEGTRGRPLREAVLQTARGRVGRRASVRFAYPGIKRTRRPWLVQHDEVHRALRGPLAELARSTDSCVIAGTAILDHPRTHWEDWPDTGNLFHTTWCFGQDAEPVDVLRHSVPGWRILDRCGVDPSLNERRTSVETPMGPVSVLWNDTGYATPPKGPILWAPRAWDAEEAAGDSSPARSPSALLDGEASIGVRTCLVGDMGGTLAGESFIASRRQDGVVACQVAPWPKDGMSWCIARLPWPWRESEAGAGD